MQCGTTKQECRYPASRNCGFIAQEYSIDDFQSNLDVSFGRLNYSVFLAPCAIDMWIDVYGAYDSDCQAAEFAAVVEETDCVCKQDWLKDVTFFRA